MTEAEIRVTHFEDKRRGHKPRSTDSHWELKRQGREFSPKAS